MSLLMGAAEEKISILALNVSEKGLNVSSLITATARNKDTSDEQFMHITFRTE